MVTTNHISLKKFLKNIGPTFGLIALALGINTIARSGFFTKGCSKDSTTPLEKKLDGGDSSNDAGSILDTNGPKPDSGTRRDPFIHTNFDGGHNKNTSGRTPQSNQDAGSFKTYDAGTITKRDASYSQRSDGGSVKKVAKPKAGDKKAAKKPITITNPKLKQFTFVQVESNPNGYDLYQGARRIAELSPIGVARIFNDGDAASGDLYERVGYSGIVDKNKVRFVDTTGKVRPGYNNKNSIYVLAKRKDVQKKDDLDSDTDMTYIFPYREIKDINQDPIVKHHKSRVFDYRNKVHGEDIQGNITLVYIVDFSGIVHVHEVDGSVSRKSTGKKDPSYGSGLVKIVDRLNVPSAKNGIYKVKF